jgi:hypothetical protein
MSTPITAVASHEKFTVAIYLMSASMARGVQFLLGRGWINCLQVHKALKWDTGMNTLMVTIPAGDWRLLEDGGTGLLLALTV